MIYKLNDKEYKQTICKKCPMFPYMECRYYFLLYGCGDDVCKYPDSWRETIASKIKGVFSK